MYGPGSAPTGAFCLHQIMFPDSENDSSRRLCSFFDEIVLLLWKNCEKNVSEKRSKRAAEKIFSAAHRSSWFPYSASSVFSPVINSSREEVFTV